MNGIAKQILLLVLLKTTYGQTTTMVFPGPDNAVIQCDSVPSSWTFTPPGSSTPGSLPANVFISGQSATLLSPSAYHEGLYTCLDSDQNVISTVDVIILGLAKYTGCPSQSACDNDLSYSLSEGQSLPINISFDFYNGGDSNGKQLINFVFIRNPDNTQIVSCKPSTMICTDLEKEGLITFPVKKEFEILTILSNRTVEDSGIYTVNAELYTTNSAITSITSYFTVAVTATTTTTTTVTTVATTTSEPPYMVTTSSSIITSTTSTSTISISSSSSSYVVPTSSSTTTSSTYVYTPTSSVTDRSPTTITSSRITYTISSNNDNGVLTDSETTTSTTTLLSVNVNNVENRGPPIDMGYIILFIVLGLLAVGLFILAIAVVMFKKSRRRKGKGKYDASKPSSAATAGGDGPQTTYVVSLQRRDEEKVITSTCEIPLRESFKKKKNPEQCNNGQRETIQEDTYCEITQSVFNCGSHGTDGVYAFTTVMAGSLPHEGNSSKVMI